MKYHLTENWTVTVNIEVTHDSATYNFNFDFIVSTNESWKEIIKTAKSIIIEKFGHSGYKFIKISLVNKN